jgi:hypothetical protein
MPAPNQNAVTTVMRIPAPDANNAKSKPRMASAAMAATGPTSHPGGPTKTTLAPFPRFDSPAGVISVHVLFHDIEVQIQLRSNVRESRMRIIVGASFLIIVCLAASAEAQQPNPPTSIERVWLGLQRPQQQPGLNVPTLPSWMDPAPRRLGMLTLLPPQTNGGLIRVAVPVGDLAARAARAVSSARHRRAERKASERVQRALQNFQAQLPAR